MEFFPIYLTTVFVASIIPGQDPADGPAACPFRTNIYPASVPIGKSQRAFQYWP